VIAGDVVRGLNGVEDLEIRLRHEPQHRLCVRGPRNGRDDRQHARRHRRLEATSIQTHHRALPLEVAVATLATAKLVRYS
jgi:hypothetical protein